MVAEHGWIGDSMECSQCQRRPCAQKSSAALEINPPEHSTCTADPGQLRKETFSTQSLKIERMHLEKGALNIPSGRQDVDTTHNRQSLFLTRGIHAA